MTRVLYLLFILSGAAGLIYESIWTRYLGLFVGHDAYAQIIVLVIFLGGMSAGATVVSRFSDRLRDPLRGYALVELAVGLIGMIFHEAFNGVTGFAYSSVYPMLAGTPMLGVAKWSIASALILPQSILLGATFPLMSAGVLRIRRGRQGHTLALLYFANSLGAAAGVLVSGFYLVSLAGLPGTLLVAAMINLVVALITFGVVMSVRKSGPADAATPAVSTGSAPDYPGRLAAQQLGPLLLFTSFGTAVASFIYEIDWIRMLSLVLGSATHSFELMLSAFILGLALGALWIRGRVDRLRNPIRTLGLVQWTMGLMALATLPFYVASFDWIAKLMTTFAKTDLGYGGFTAARYALCLVIMLPATFCAGMTLPIITRTLIRSGAGERAIGRVYAWNTLGSIVGVAVAGMVLLPMVGVKTMLVIGGALDMVIGVVLVFRSTDRRMGAGWLTALSPRALAVGLAVATVAVSVVVSGGVELEKRLLISGVYRHGKVTESNRWDVLFYRDGRTATVSGIRVQSSGQLSLATNGKPDASLSTAWFKPCDSSAAKVALTGDAATQALTPLVTLAHNPRARSAAIVGYGSGMTTHVMLGNPAIKEVVTIEIEPQMIEGARVFYPANRRATEDPRSRLVIDDAKSYFASEHRRFDLILSEPSNPWVSGVSGLFTTEFYARVGEYLTDDGVFGQWMQTYELSDGLVLSVLAAIEQNFRSYEVYITSAGDLLIVASKRAQLPRPDWSVVNLPGVQADLCHFHPLTPAALDGLRLVGRRELAPLLATFGQPNSDYYPVLDLGAEQRRYLRESARGFWAMSSDWYNLLASISGQRNHGSGDTLITLPESPRIRSSALSAQVRRWQTAPKGRVASNPDMEQAAYVTEQWRAWLEKGQPPSSWQLWLNQMELVARIFHAGRAGMADEEFFAAASRYAERFQAPGPVKDVVAFRHALASWNFSAAAAAADRLAPVVLREKRWITADELRDGAVMAKLHTGDAKGARAALDALRQYSTRSPDDLRSRMLEAFVQTAEGRVTEAVRR